MLVAASITETLLLQESAIYEKGAAPAILTSTKIMAIETQAVEHNLCLLIIHFNAFTNVIKQKTRKPLLLMGIDKNIIRRKYRIN